MLSWMKAAAARNTTNTKTTAETRIGTRAVGAALAIVVAIRGIVGRTHLNVAVTLAGARTRGMGVTLAGAKTRGMVATLADARTRGMVATLAGARTRGMGVTLAGARTRGMGVTLAGARTHVNVAVTLVGWIPVIGATTGVIPLTIVGTAVVTSVLQRSIHTIHALTVSSDHMMTLHKL
jgi:hypothetical protein